MRQLRLLVFVVSCAPGQPGSADASCVDGTCAQQCNTLDDCEDVGEACVNGACVVRTDVACGDGIFDRGEACDDENSRSGDGCSDACTVEPGFDCEGQPSACGTTCGDGVAVAQEECDDGGVANNDGCSASCTVEVGWSCDASGCVLTCPGSTTDSDGDRVPDDCDACPGNDDRIDTDGDGVPDGCDACPGSDDSIDSDTDTVADGCDLCEGADDRQDADGDTVPDACDYCDGGDDRQDADGDTVPDACDICAGNDDLQDADDDSVPNGCDICQGSDDQFDADNDGVPDGCDVCAGYDDNQPPSSVDDPEPLAAGLFIDSNCDQVDGDASIAVFVSPSGKDTNLGERLSPFKSVQRAIDRAAANGRAHVYVAAGFYPEQIQLEDGVSVFGGYTNAFRRRDPSALASLIPNESVALLADGTDWTESIIVEGFELLPRPGATPGQSSRAAVVSNVQAPAQILFRSVLFIPSTGADGADGQDGDDGLPGGPGGDGRAWTFDISNGIDDGAGQPAAGPDWCPVLGGTGGAGVEGSLVWCAASENGFPGTAGQSGSPTSPAPGALGIGGRYAFVLAAAPSEPGGDSIGPAQDGANATAIAIATQQAGAIAGTDWSAGDGGDDAADGASGSGGGGGGSGASLSSADCPSGSGGGAGGGGGCAGGRGRGGGGAGGSIGLMVVNSDGVALQSCSIQTSDGGTGGGAGSGGRGGRGGGSGLPGVGPSCVPIDVETCSSGGGRGSDAGDGGGAQGGGGGAAVGILCSNAGSLCTDAVDSSNNNSFTLGEAGPGGSGGLGVSGAAADGAVGVSQSTWEL